MIDYAQHFFLVTKKCLFVRIMCMYMYSSWLMLLSILSSALGELWRPNNKEVNQRRATFLGAN